MAVYYKWIKGCAPGASLSNGLWTYLKWGKIKDNGDSDTVIMPTLRVVAGKEDDTTKGTDLGYLLTNEVPTPTLTNEWIFQNGIRCNKISACSGGDKIVIGAGGASNIDISAPINMGKVTITSDVESNGQIFSVKANMITLTHDSQEHPLILTSNDKGFIFNGSINTRGNISVTDYIHSSSYCEAEYFNATSDIRAKENIKPATYNALELIKKLQIYTYNYINKPESVTGIMAQELLEAQPKELDLVSNVNASGENGDYMSIKNDKLMFVLMKAIQEQQEKIEALEYELQCLKNN